MHNRSKSHQHQQKEQLQQHSRDEKWVGTRTNIRGEGIQHITKYLLIVSSLFVVNDVLLEQVTYPTGNLIGMYFAYLAVPFFISSVLLAAYVYSYRFVKIAWRNRGVELLSVVAGIAYAMFYIFTTNMVSIPDVPMPPHLQGFILPFQVYSQMTTWPDVEFWSPQLNLVGYFSVGNVLVVSSLAILTSFSVALLAHNIKTRLAGKQGCGSFVGSFAVSLSTNACCCCTPVVLPLVSAFFGLASTKPLVEDIAFQTFPIFNLLWIGTIGLLLASVLLSSRKFEGCSP